MRLSSLFLYSVLAFSLVACGSTKKAEEAAPDTRKAEEIFASGQQALAKDLYKTAYKEFDEIERLHPYADVAPEAKLLSAYAHYLNEDYEEAVSGFDQYLQLYPSDKQAPYALYLKALCYYEQISDVTRDQEMTRRALEALQLVVSRYPTTDYAKEAKLKLDLTYDHLAGKEMEIGRWYQEQNQLQAAINRFRAVIDQYQTTSHTPEALFRLVECYTELGLHDEARSNAAVLGHNFPGSPWYLDAYKLVGGDPAAIKGETDAAPSKPGFFGRAWKSVF